MAQLSESEDARSMGSTADFHMGQFSLLPSGSQSATPLRAASSMVIETAPRVTAASPLSSLAAANIPIAPDPEALSPPGPPRGEVKWQQQHPQSTPTPKTVSESITLPALALTPAMTLRFHLLQTLMLNIFLLITTCYQEADFEMVKAQV